MIKLKIVKGVIRLAASCPKVGRGELLDHFCRMTNFLPERYQNKMTT